MKALAQNSLIQNRYLIVHLIGKGGMGEVYLAVDQRLGSAIALKRTYFADDEMLKAAFEREARTLARMRHPVLPKVSDHFGEGDEQYLIMEHIAGDDLAKRLEAAQKPFPVSWVMFWADQLLDALSYLHSHEPPIIHRDIKPQNLKLTDENHIILLDFGLSKTSTGQTAISQSGSTGSVVGYTPHYAPMEQIRGIGTNPRSDIYSLSATLYQLMTNVIPDDALSRADSMLNGLADPVEPPHKLNPEIPSAVSEVILQGMEVSQEKRFANARDMQKALRRAFTQMQEAMSAQTMAFNINDIMPPEQPMASSIEKTHLMPSIPLESQPQSQPVQLASQPENGAIDLDATIAFDPLENAEHARNLASQGEEIPPAPPADSIDQLAADDEHTSFVTVAAGAGSAFSEYQAKPEPKEEPSQVSKTAKAKNGSGKALAVIGGLVALLVLALGAAGAGWYFYNRMNPGAAVVEPSPSPEASVEATPVPSPTEEVSTEANTYSESSPSSSPTPGSNTSNSAVPEIPGRSSSSIPPPRPDSTTTRPAANRAAPAAPRATPKPNSNPGRRTDILQ
ncbi:MAG: hypothetical protein DMF63_15270 [Acidobacteria bacterium]|nr:MAG: hypothetical protein DMF63_15270 [Acidobacteriota bacterium]